MTKTQLRICKNALVYYGEISQLGMLNEEMGELITACNKYFNRGGCSKEDVITELADVEIMCTQLRLILKEDAKVEEQIAFKLKRLENRIIEDNNG